LGKLREIQGKAESNAQVFLLLRVSFCKHAFYLFVVPTFPRSLIELQDQNFFVAVPPSKWFCGLKTAACRPVDIQDGEAGGELAA
jgi:hypothetical protein